MNELSLFSESMNGAQSTDMEQSVKASGGGKEMFNFNLTAMNPPFHIMNGDRERAQTWGRIKTAYTSRASRLYGVYMNYTS